MDDFNQPSAGPEGAQASGKFDQGQAGEVGQAQAKQAFHDSVEQSAQAMEASDALRPQPAQDLTADQIPSQAAPPATPAVAPEGALSEASPLTAARADEPQPGEALPPAVAPEAAPLPEQTQQNLQTAQEMLDRVMPEQIAQIEQPEGAPAVAGGKFTEGSEQVEAAGKAVFHESVQACQPPRQADAFGPADDLEARIAAWEDPPRPVADQEIGDAKPPAVPAADPAQPDQDWAQQVAAMAPTINMPGISAPVGDEPMPAPADEPAPAHAGGDDAGPQVTALAEGDPQALSQAEQPQEPALDAIAMAAAAETAAPEAPPPAAPAGPGDEVVPTMEQAVTAEEAAAAEEAARRDDDPEPADPEAATVEAILFASDAPLPASKISQVAELSGQKAVNAAVQRLNARYAEIGSAFRIEAIAGGYQMLTIPRYHNVLSALFRVKSDSRLSQAAMETLAIVAYRQPILRADIEAIRGVASGEVLRSLMDRQLVKIVGRAEVLGRPMLYGTTRRFLEVFGLSSLEDLPRVEELKSGAKESAPRPAGAPAPTPAAPAANAPAPAPAPAEITTAGTS